jgi:hypothetical protein
MACFRALGPNRAFVAGCATLAAVGCGAGASENPTLRIERVSIDSGEELRAEPGRGVGVHVEVDRRGRWTTFFTCDTEESGYPCDFDLLASVEPPFELRDVRPRELELDDFWYRVDGGAIHVFAFTAFDVDEISFDAPVGEKLRIDVLLDGRSTREVVAWVDDGAARTSAPSMPFELVPTTE